MINKTTKLNFGKFSYTFLVLLLLASCNNTIEPTSQIQKPIEINTTTKKPVEKVSKDVPSPCRPQKPTRNQQLVFWRNV